VEVLGRLMRGEFGEGPEFDEAKSGFILPIDIFFKKPHRLFF